MAKNLRVKLRTMAIAPPFDPLSWLRDRGGRVGSVVVAQWPQTAHGAGLCATADIARGERTWTNVSTVSLRSGLSRWVEPHLHSVARSVNARQGEDVPARAEGNT